MSLAVVTLKKGEGRTLKAGGAWVYDNEIANIHRILMKTEISFWCMILTVIPWDAALSIRHSKIRIRMMTRKSGPGDRRDFLTDAGKRRLGISEKDRGHFQLPPDFR